MGNRPRHNYKNLKIWNLGLEIAHHKKYISNNTLETFERKIQEWQKMTSGFQNGLDI